MKTFFILYFNLQHQYVVLHFYTLFHKGFSFTSYSMKDTRKIGRRTSIHIKVERILSMRKSYRLYQCQSFFLTSILLVFYYFHCPWAILQSKYRVPQYNFYQFVPIFLSAHWHSYILTEKSEQTFFHLNMFQNIVFVHCDQFSRHFLSIPLYSNRQSMRMEKKENDEKVFFWRFFFVFSFPFFSKLTKCTISEH